MFKGGGGGGGVGFTPDFCENTILPKIFKIFGVLANKFFCRAQHKIPLNKISSKFSCIAILKISCKNIENGGGVGQNVKSIFAKSRTEILAILWIVGGFYGIKWLNWMQFSGDFL